MSTKAMKRISGLGQYSFLAAYNEAIFQRTAAQKVIYVDSNTGTDSSGRSGEDIRSPFATIDYAIGKCTANNGDTILVLPRHAETVTSPITFDVAYVQCYGLMQGNLRPIITGNAADDAMTITAAGCRVSGLAFAGPLTDAQTADINIAAAYAHISDMTHLGSVGTENKVNIYTITADGDYCRMENIRIDNTLVEVVGAILFEGAATNIFMKNVYVYDVIGFTNGALYDAAAATGVVLVDCVFSNAKAATAVIDFTNNSVGYGMNIGVNGRNTTIASNITAGTSFNFFPALVVEEVAKSGMVWSVDAE